MKTKKPIIIAAIIGYFCVGVFTYGYAANKALGQGLKPEETQMIAALQGLFWPIYLPMHWSNQWWAKRLQ